MDLLTQDYIHKITSMLIFLHIYRNHIYYEEIYFLSNLY